MRLTTRRTGTALAGGLLPLAALLLMTGRATAQTSGSGFVSASGSHLVTLGQPWRFIGYNMPCDQPFTLLQPGSQPFVFQNIAANSGATAMRMWFFQKNGGPGNWAQFDQTIANAKAAGMRIIPTLVNEWPTCEPTTALKTLAWYQAGYKQTGDGYPLSFRAFAVQMAAHYANEPSIAFWQLVNEAEAPTTASTCDEPTAAMALRTFADDMTGAMHAADPHHLVSLGTLGGSQCGIAGNDYSAVHGGAVDLCEFHDYGDPLDPLEKTQTDGLLARLQQCKSLANGGKPMFIGEAGIVHNVQPAPPEPAAGSTTPTVTLDSLNLRANLFRAKINDAFGAGVAGYDIWFKGPAFDSTGDSFSIGDGDPVEAVMKSIDLRAPPSTVPETSKSILLPISAIVVLGGGGGLVWWRRRKIASTGHTAHRSVSS